MVDFKRKAQEKGNGKLVEDPRLGFMVLIMQDDLCDLILTVLLISQRVNLATIGGVLFGHFPIRGDHGTDYS